jgi:hypothetical protein
VFTKTFCGGSFSYFFCFCFLGGVLGVRGDASPASLASIAIALIEYWCDEQSSGCGVGILNGVCFSSSSYLCPPVEVAWCTAGLALTCGDGLLDGSLSGPLTSTSLLLLGLLSFYSGSD